MKLEDVPISDTDAAVIVDPVSETPYLIEQVAGNRFNVYEVDSETGDPINQPTPFDSMSDALRHLAEEFE